MPYPEPNYRTPTILTSVYIATVYLPLLQNITKGAGYGGLTVEANIAYMLGLAVRQGLPRLEEVDVGIAYIDRFTARFGSQVTRMDAYLFADDVTLATTVATDTARSIGNVYRTAAHINISIRYFPAGGNQFFIPKL